MSCTELAASMAGPLPPAVLDVRWRLGGPPGREDYERGHLPNAIHLDLDTDLAGPPGAAGRHPLPDPEVLERALRAAGVRADRPVVVYDADNGSIAARAWWLLRWAGHGEVAVLDGGFAGWTAEGRLVTTAAPRPEPGDITVRPGGMPVLDAAGAAALARDGVLLDARAPERYRGDVEPIDPRAGHIPGAVNAPFAGHVGEDGRWRRPARLAERFAGVGVGAADGEPVGAYCGSGVTAASVVLALEVAGVTSPIAPAELYVGSWSEWSGDPDRPVATGNEPG
ncbi:MAG: sulfurtransferase [Actinophytocola sp.]|uniref:sulfurtransferase n=1 Tax=Actinophytocola sp. TaxID=1872138 RepID=UPI00132230F7|nr:sulfurtransferase [Actinophytocola sp.]MPZ82831.1 sulfurtransferase [Actinophytocola sp.]